MKLAIKLGGRRIALGAVVEAWIVAQPYWVNSKNGIPKPAWNDQELANELIDVGLARDDGDFIYMKGSEEQFKWIKSKQTNGKSGGEAKARNHRKITLAKTSDDLAPLPSSSSSSSSSSSLKKNTRSLALAETAVAKSPAAPGVSEFIGQYVKAFQKRYGEETRPNLSGKVRGQIIRFLSETPIDRAVNMIQVYLQMDDKWFTTKTHDFSTFVENLSKIGVALDTGKSLDGINWEKIFK